MMNQHYNKTLTKLKSYEQDNQKLKNSRGVHHTSRNEHVLLAVEIEFYQPEYTNSCEPENLHQIVKKNQNKSQRCKKAWMKFTSRGIVFEEQQVDFCDQIASSTLYKIKNVKGMWVDPTFRPFIALVIRCGRSSLMIFVVKILMGSMREIVESFHTMKQQNDDKNIVSYKHSKPHSIERRNGDRNVESRQSHHSKHSHSPNIITRYKQNRSSSIDVQFQETERESHRKNKKYKKNEKMNSRENITIKKHKRFVECIRSISSDDLSKEAEKDSPIEQSDVSIVNVTDEASPSIASPVISKDTMDPSNPAQDSSFIVNNSSQQIGVQYEELKSSQNTEDCPNKSEDYSSINSQFRDALGTAEIAKLSDQSKVSNQIRSDEPIDALFRELHVVREQLEQLKAPEHEKMHWFETDMEQMKNELRHIRTKLDDCVITQINEPDRLMDYASTVSSTAPARIFKINNTSRQNIKHDIPNQKYDSTAGDAEYENVDYLKKVGNFPNYYDPTGDNTSSFIQGFKQPDTKLNYVQTRPEIQNNNAEFYQTASMTSSYLDNPPYLVRSNAIQGPSFVSSENDNYKLRAPEKQPHSTIPFMTPFFSNQLTNPMFVNNRTLLLNTLGNQFNLSSDSPKLLDIANNQGKYLSGRRTFANIIWNMSAEEESILQRKSPSPTVKSNQRFVMRNKKSNISSRLRVSDVVDNKTMRNNIPKKVSFSVQSG